MDAYKYSPIVQFNTLKYTDFSKALFSVFIYSVFRDHSLGSTNCQKQDEGVERTWTRIMWHA